MATYTRVSPDTTPFRFWSLTPGFVPNIESLATLYATISASFVIEQEGLPHITQTPDEEGTQLELWNGDSPQRRLQALQIRLLREDTK